MELVKELIKEKPKKEECCVELKNIKYKTMLLSGSVPHETKTSNDLSHLEKFLEDDKNNNNSLNDLPWSKLDKTIKTKKLLAYTEKYAAENVLSLEEKELMVSFLKESLDKKKLQRVKDVEYDKTIGEIKSIPALLYVKQSKHFTLKNVDKRVSTLKSLPPKKLVGSHKHSTIKHVKNVIEVLETLDNNEVDADEIEDEMA
jgi:hypothetical protein